MAYVYKGAGAVAEPTSALARSGDFGRQRDTYILASRYKNRDCIRLWNDFAAEQPAMARLIIKDVENDRQESAAASEALDGRLREAEQLVVKARKAKVSKSRNRPSAAADDELSAVLAIIDPARREFEYGRLMERRG